MGDDNNVPFTLYASNKIDSIEKTEWEEITEINFSNGGAFIADGSIQGKHVPAIIRFFTGLITFASNNDKFTKWKKDSAIHDSLPKVLIKFASQSRADSGYRLLKRSVRHAMDSKCQSLENKTVMLILHGNDIGIHLHSHVPASMRKGVT